MIQSWTQWQQDVLAVLRREFEGVFQNIGLEDVDWESWRGFYTDSRTPRAAVDRALERDL